MNGKKYIIRTIIGALLFCTPFKAHADSACWSPDELKAYDITMQTLVLAHVATDCDAITASSGTPLRAEVAEFLGRFESQLNSDRQDLGGFYQRAYGEDWETPLNKSLSREDGRVATSIKQDISPQFCSAAAGMINTLKSQSWDAFVKDAQSQEWDKKAGFPACH